jgi:NADPH:quinone reductase-like Zn-dependent oxidoreductase
LQLEHSLGARAFLTFEQAAVLAIMGSTALQALRDHGKVRQGQEVPLIVASARSWARSPTRRKLRIC